MYFNHNKAQRYLLVLFFILFFILIYLLNHYYPLWADDWNYSFIWNSADNQRITGISDIIVSQYNHYFLWGGRIVTHIIAHLLLMIDTGWRHFINTLAYLAFTYIIYKYINKGKPVNAWIFLFVNAFVFIAQRTFCNTAVWITGSANYLWGTLIILTFMYPFYSFYINRNKRKDNIVKTSGIFVLGILAGWTNENTVLAMLAGLLVIFLILRTNKTDIPKWFMWGIVGACIGFILMAIAPGNFIRAAITVEERGMTNNILMDILQYRIPTLFKRYFPILFLLSVVWWILVRFFMKDKKNNDIDRRKINFSILLFFCAHLGFFAMTASAYFPTRATFGIITFMIIAIGILAVNSDFAKKKLKYLNKKTLLCTLCICFIFYYNYRIQNVYYLWEEIQKRKISLNEQQSEGINDIIFSNRIKVPREFSFYDLREDPDYWINKGFTKYYNINSVRLIVEKSE